MKILMLIGFYSIVFLSGLAVGVTLMTGMSLFM